VNAVNERDEVDEVAEMTEGTERPQTTRIAMVRAQSRVTVTGVVRSVTTEGVGSSPAVRCVLADGSGQLDLLFLGAESLLGLVPGRRCTATGRACVRRGRLVLWNPRYQLDPPVSPTGAAPPNGHGAGGRVLVIGDDPGLSRVIEVNLVARGYRVDAAATAAEASSMAGRCLSLVIVDLGLANADGVQPVTSIRGRSARVPVLAVSARGGEDVRRAAIAAGADDFLAKPFPIGDLLLKVRQAARPGVEGRAPRDDNDW
jgi:CheY-like chemotaxis protein